MQLSDEEGLETEQHYWSKQDPDMRAAHIKGIRDRIDAGDMSLVRVIPKNYIKNNLHKRAVHGPNFPTNGKPVRDYRKELEGL
jgi:hypothetical protein